MAVDVVAVDRVDAALEEEGHDRQDAERAEAVLENPAETVVWKGGHPQLVQDAVAHDARNGQLNQTNLAGFVASNTLGDAWMDRHFCEGCEMSIDVCVCAMLVLWSAGKIAMKAMLTYSTVVLECTTLSGAGESLDAILNTRL